MQSGSRAALAALALILGYQLLIPPISGLADQGDYARISGVFGLGPQTKDPTERFYGYLNRIYLPDATFRTPQLEVVTSEYLFVAAAVGLNSWISKDGSFDIRVLGAMHLLAFLGLVAWLLTGSDALLRPVSRWIVRLGLIVIFADAGYVVYFNSFYSEPASYLFLIALFAASLAIARKPSPGSILVWTVAAALLILAKTQNCLLGAVLAAYAATWWRRRAQFAAVILFAVSCFTFWNAPQGLKHANVFNHLFLQILPDSRHPAVDLKWFGLDESWLRYAGMGAYTPGSPFADPGKAEEVNARVNFAKLGLFYVENPSAFWRLTRRMLRESASTRTNYGNFERQYGYPAGFHSRAFSFWNELRFRWISQHERWPLFWLVLVLAGFAWMRRRRGKPREHFAAEMGVLLAVAALVSFFTAILGDGYDTQKHLYLFDILLDSSLVFVLVFLGERFRQSAAR